MYTRDEIEKLLEEYALALAHNFNARRDYEDALANAYLSGKIDGKNAELRAAQEFAEAGGRKGIMESTALSVKAIEARIGLVKALLHNGGVE